MHYEVRRQAVHDGKRTRVVDTMWLWCQLESVTKDGTMQIVVRLPIEGEAYQTIWLSYFDVPLCTLKSLDGNNNPRLWFVVEEHEDGVLPTAFIAEGRMFECNQPQASNPALYAG